MILDLVHNVALLIALAVGLRILSQRIERRSVAHRLAEGLLYGAVGVVGMLTPIRFAPGVIYDGRSIVLSLAGLFGGGGAAAISGLICGGYRAYLGGAGAAVGTAVIVESAALGVALHYLRRRDEKWVSPLRLWLFGMLIHSVMLGLQLLLPEGVGWAAVRRVGPLVIVLYPVGFLLIAMVFLEIERHRDALRNLFQSEQRYRSLFENNHAVMLLIDPASGTIVDANPAACAFYGWPRDQLCAMRVSDISTMSADGIREAMQEAVRSERFHSVFQHRLVDGRLRDVEVYSGPIRVGEQDLLYSLVHDITERREAEKAYGTSVAFQKAMIDCSPVALYSIDTAGNVQSWNGSAERVFGWRAEEVLGRPLPIIPPEPEAGFARFKAEVLKGRVFTGREVIRQRKCGELFHGRLSTAPIRDGCGEVVGIMGAMEDITESRKLEEQLLQAQKMESVGRLAGGVAHDFNNMLNVILGHAEMVLDILPEDSPLRENLSEIRVAGLRSADLTRQLLAFARRQTVEPRVLNLNGTIETMLKMLRRLIGEDIDLLWQPGGDMEPILIDPAQIDQLLANLVVNARDAIGPGVGKVTIETGMKDFDEEHCASHVSFSPGRYCMLAVSDDGCGMDEVTKSQIFEPFFTTKERGEGTGLGLATVYGVVRQNDGFINVYSEPGQGTTFRIYLPAQTAAEVSPVAQESQGGPSQGSGETILVVEDEPATLRLAAKLLDRLGYKALTAGTPREAIRLAQEHNGGIDLLITDVVMPEMNGRDLAAHLILTCPRIRCLFMSGYTANVIAHHGVLDAGVDFVQKPFSIQDLAEKVRAVLDRDAED